MLPRRRGARITVPAVVMTEWWRGGLRETERRAILRSVIVEELQKSLAIAAGVALGLVRGSTQIDAIVMASAATRDDIVYTSDPDDLEALRRSVPQFANVPLVVV